MIIYDPHLVWQNPKFYFLNNAGGKYQMIAIHKACLEVLHLKVQQHATLIFSLIKEKEKTACFIILIVMIKVNFFKSLKGLEIIYVVKKLKAMFDFLFLNQKKSCTSN